SSSRFTLAQEVVTWSGRRSRRSPSTVISSRHQLSQSAPASTGSRSGSAAATGCGGAASGGGTSPASGTCRAAASPTRSARCASGLASAANRQDRLPASGIPVASAGEQGGCLLAGGARAGQVRQCLGDLLPAAGQRLTPQPPGPVG